MTKKITICADDFALTPEISDAIVSLIQNKRISAASCMTSMKHWQIDARKLLDLPVKADIGLHLNLTEPPFLILPGKFSLPELILKSYLNYLNEKIIEQELETQLLKFQEAMGRLPDFLDGHEHIHVLPVIRNIVIHLYEKYFPNKNAYIRLPLTRKKSNFKSQNYEVELLLLLYSLALFKCCLSIAKSLSSSISSTSMVFTRAIWPQRTFTELLATHNTSARRSSSSRLARPSAGGAETLQCNTLSTSSIKPGRWELAVTRTLRRHIK